jgi:amino acid adenylation domain-containing protein
MSKDFHNDSFSDTLVAFSSRTEARDYWMSRLAARKTDTGFPHSSGQRNERGYAIISVAIPDDLAKRLSAVCSDDQSLRVLLMANLVVQLQKFVNVDTITVGTTGGGISKAVPIVVTINGSMTFREVLMQTRQECLQALEHHDYPIGLLFNSQDRESDNRLFSVGLLVGDEGADDLHAQAELAFALNRNDKSISCNLTFAKNAFVERDVRAFFETFITLLYRCLKEPDLAISRLVPYTDETGNKMLVDFNQTGSLYANTSIADVFEECAAAAPDKVALVHNDLHITYGELSGKTSHIAGALRKRGVMKNTPVIVLQPTGADYIITILAILKAGGVYVPVDPEYPAQRIKYLIDDVGAKIIVTCTASSNPGAMLGTSPEVSIVSVDALVNEDVSDGHAGDAGGDLAYVLFTSGSTGTPKGVLISHRNVLRLVMNANYVSFSANTRVLQTGAITFDATTFEIWGSLLNGGTLILIDKPDLLDPDRLAEKLTDSDANTLWLTAPFFNQLVDHAGTGMFKRLEWLLVGGDVLSPAHINQVRSAHEHLNIVNAYGPTENTTFSLTHNIQHAHDGPIPIGKPIGNATGFVLNEQLEPMPMLGWGILYVGGDGVTKGYLNNPELTHAKLIRHELAGNGVLYRTDDVVRMLPDCNVEFKGRLDHQVKIRGYRVELGEIEAQMLSIPGIRNCVVTARRVDTSGDTKLCAYFIAAPDVDKIQCKTFLASVLPAHMVPHHFVRLEEFPLTPHGKLDTKALPAPEAAASQPVHPLGYLEKQMADIWATVLGVDAGALHALANFFELGGHSLRAIALLSSIQREFNVKVTISQLFKNPRLEALTALVRSAKGRSHAGIKRAEHKEYYLLPSPQKRMFITRSHEYSVQHRGFRYFYRMPGSQAHG